MLKLKSLANKFVSERCTRVRAFACDERGVTAIEFGVLAIPFFALIGAILETSLVFFAGQVLDTALESAGRLIRTGQAQSNASYSATDFKAAICSQAYGLFGDCSGLDVKVSIVTNFAAATATPPVYQNGHWTPPQTCFQIGQGDQVIMVQAYYKWPVILNFGGFNLQTAGDGTHLLSAVRVFSNEPFGGTAVVPTCT